MASGGATREIGDADDFTGVEGASVLDDRRPRGGGANAEAASPAGLPETCDSPSAHALTYGEDDVQTGGPRRAPNPDREVEN